MGGKRGRLISAPDRQKAVKLIKNALSKKARLTKICSALKISVNTYKRWSTDGKNSLIDNRHNVHRLPKNKLSTAEEQEILSIVNSEEFCDKTPYYIVPKLLDRGIYFCSISTVYRVLKRLCMTKCRADIAQRVRREPPTHKASGPCQLWSWDITYMPSMIRGVYYFFYVIIDVYSRKIVAWEVWEEQSAEHASELLLRAYRLEKIPRNSNLVLHSDNGGPMKGQTMLATMQWLGIKPSFNRPRVSNDNQYSESLFNTAKHHTPFRYPKYFDSLTHCRTWAEIFVNWYNNENFNSGINYITPSSRHSGKDSAIFNNRNIVMESAKAIHPERWNSRPTKKWFLPDYVYLNPVNCQEKTPNENKFFVQLS